MHELNAPLWTECRQNAKKNAKNAQKCTSQKRYQFVAKTVLIPGWSPLLESVLSQRRRAELCLLLLGAD